MSKKQLFSRLENLFSSIEESAPQPVEPLAASPWTWEWECSQQGYYTSCSTGVEMHLGVPAEQFTGQPVGTYLLDPDSAQALTGILTDLNTGPAELDLVFRCPDGHNLSVRYSLTPQFDPAGTPTGWRGTGLVLEPPPSSTPPLPEPLPEPQPQASAAAPADTVPVGGNGKKPAPEKHKIYQKETPEPGTNLAVPFRFSQDGKGSLELRYAQEQFQPNEEESLLIQEVLDQLSLAIDNIRLYDTAQQEIKDRIQAQEELIQHNQDLASLNQISQKMATLSNQREILSISLQALQEFIDCRNVLIAISNESGTQFEIPIALVDHQETAIQPRPFAHGVIEHVIQSKTPLSFNQDVAGQYAALGLDLPERTPASVLAVPMLAGRRSVGMYLIEDFEKENAFTEIQLELVSTLAAQTTAALENSVLINRITDALDELEVRERYQANVAQAVASLTQYGTRSLPEALSWLGEAAQCSRVYYAQSEVNDQGKYWQVLEEWSQPDAGSEPARGKIIPWDEMWAEELSKRGWLRLVRRDARLGTAVLRQHTFETALLLYVRGKNPNPNMIIFESPHSDPSWPGEEVSVLQVAADSLSSTIIREDLLQQLQDSLKETEKLYLSSYNLALANTAPDMLTAILTGVNAAGINRAALIVFEEISENVTRAIVSASWYSGFGPEPFMPGYELFAPLVPYLKTREALYVSDITQAGYSDPVAEYLSTQKIRSLAVIPTRVGSTQTGCLLLQATQPRQFSGRETRSFPPLVDQMALRLENLRLFEQTQKALAETEMLYRISDGIAQAIDAQSLVDLVVTNAMPTGGEQLFLFDIAYNNLGEPSYLDLSGYYNHNPLNNRSNLRLPAASLPLVRSLTTGVNYIADIAASKLDATSRSTLAQLSMQTACLVPLHTAGNVIGLLIVSAAQVTEFFPEEIILLEIAANGISIALERQRLLEEAQRRALELEAAAEIARDTTSTLSQDTLLQRIVTLVQSRFNLYHVAIYMLDEQGKSAEVREAYGATGKQMKQQGSRLAVGGRSVVGTAIATGILVTVNDVTTSSVYSANPLLSETRSEMGIPLKAGDRVIGALDIHANRINAFTPDDTMVMQILADQIAVAIENARAYELSQKAIIEMQEIDRIKSQFLANMSHELRTPLNSIIGFSRVILKGIDGPISEDQTQDLTAIYNSGQHLLNLINDILDLSKIEAGKMELSFTETNLEEIIQSVMSTAIGLVKDKSIQLNQNIAPDLPSVLADPTRIRQVLLNLLSNAAKFTDSGSITVNALVSQDMEDQPEIMVTVTDTGPGIAAEDQTKLFQPFSQVDDSPTRKTGGTGLGLSICRSLIDMHHGKIGVLSSEVGKGTTFFFTLPLAKTEDPAPMPDTEAENENVILAIDDDWRVTTLYERYLGPLGYQVIPLKDSTLALERARTLKPFAITLDIMMPQKDGWQVIRELKQDPETRDIPVLICSIVEEEEKGFSLGATDYLVKPFLPEDLINAIRHLNHEGKIYEILVIDDDGEDLRMIDKLIGHDGQFKIRLAEGGIKGWSEIEAHAPDAIILDLFMPDVNGFTILERLRTDPQVRNIPVIVLTGAELSPHEHQELVRFNRQLLTKGMLRENELLQTLETTLKRYR
ncbi:MAG: GAF domain-containing protein [Anaerolineaceae bacterium]|nr:GAF domain-containing protein [Anaerolineaceae bacterium]